MFRIFDTFKFIVDPHQRHLSVHNFTAELRAQTNLNFDNLTFPVTLLSQNRKFERNNCGISMYGLDKKKEKKKKKKINDTNQEV